MNHIYSDELTLQKKVAYSQGIIAISKKNKFYFLEIQYTMERLIYETEFILFQIHDKIVGFLIYSEEKPIFSIPIPTSVPKGMFQDLQFLFIYPEERGKGYGSSLVDLYLKKMVPMICSVKSKKTEIPFWIKMGFRTEKKTGQLYTMYYKGNSYEKYVSMINLCLLEGITHLS